MIGLKHRDKELSSLSDSLLVYFTAFIFHIRRLIANLAASMRANLALWLLKDIFVN